MTPSELNIFFSSLTKGSILKEAGIPVRTWTWYQVQDRELPASMKAKLLPVLKRYGYKKKQNEKL